MSDSSPRHLAPTGRGKPAWSRRWLIAGGGVVVLAVTATAIALTRHGDDELLSGLSQLPTTPSVATTAPPATSVPPTTSRPATSAPPTTSPPATSAPPTTGAPRPVQPTPGNLLANGDFERGLAGWEPVGGRIDRVGIGHSGRWSLRLRDGGTPSPSGGAAGEPVARSTQTVQGQAGESYEASAWVRATRPGTEAILKLRELGGAGESADTIGVTLVDADWHEVAVIHQAHAGGGRLTVEAAAGNLQPGDGLLLDQISLTRSDEN